MIFNCSSSTRQFFNIENNKKAFLTNKIKNAEVDIRIPQLQTRTSKYFHFNYINGGLSRPHLSLYLMKTKKGHGQMGTNRDK